MKLKTFNPEGWAPQNYSHAIVGNGQLVTISGQLGYDSDGKISSSDFMQQARSALENLMTVLRTAGGKAEHLTQLTWYVTDMPAFRKNGNSFIEIYSTIIGQHLPSMVMVEVTALIDSDAKIEVSAQALLPYRGLRPVKQSALQILTASTSDIVNDRLEQLEQAMREIFSGD